MLGYLGGRQATSVTAPRRPLGTNSHAKHVDGVSEQVESERNIAPFITHFINVENQMIRKVMVSVAVMAGALLSHAAVADENAVNVLYAGSLVNLMERSVGPAFEKETGRSEEHTSELQSPC